MRVVMFCHSLVSDWNHGNAHFLRGVATELIARGHELAVYEPRDGWSRSQLVKDHGTTPIDEFARTFPHLSSRPYDLSTLDLDDALAGADVVLVHEWNDPRLVHRIGLHRSRRRRGEAAYRLLFHDTHHRMVTLPWEMARYDLSYYDGVLAFGRVIADLYETRGLRDKKRGPRDERSGIRAWAWHEAADTRMFFPHRERRRNRRDGEEYAGDVVWIGNWGDGERTEELFKMLLEPVQRLRLSARVYGVRYPAVALRALERAGIEYGGWLPNHRVPEIFSQFRMTVHIPRRPYRERLPGIPTIRVFEALACGIPLVSLRWNDSEGLFTPGRDYLEVTSGAGMADAMVRVLEDDSLAESLSRHGRGTVLSRHTCAHRVDELEAILAQPNDHENPLGHVVRQRSPRDRGHAEQGDGIDHRPGQALEPHVAGGVAQGVNAAVAPAPPAT
jgi:spore maturation protein CgeB